MFFVSALFSQVFLAVDDDNALIVIAYALSGNIVCLAVHRLVVCLYGVDGSGVNIECRYDGERHCTHLELVDDGSDLCAVILHEDVVVFLLVEDVVAVNCGIAVLLCREVEYETVVLIVAIE